MHKHFVSNPENSGFTFKHPLLKISGARSDVAVAQERRPLKFSLECNVECSWFHIAFTFKSAYPFPYGQHVTLLTM